jgi:hypothetical protein
MAFEEISGADTTIVLLLMDNHPTHNFNDINGILADAVKLLRSSVFDRDLERKAYFILCLCEF